MYSVGAKPLGARAVVEARAKTSPIRQQAGVRDHDAVIDAESLVRSVDLSTALSRHKTHHLLQTFVAADAADDEHLARADVGHGALGDLNEHGVHGLLETEA